MRILYAEDNPADADLTRRALERLMPEAALDVVPSLDEARRYLESGVRADVLLTDLRLPDGSGLDLLTSVREQGLPLPVVVITGSGDQTSAIAALNAGADDYLIKHGDYLARLPLTLRSAAAHFANAAARRSRPLRVLYVEHNKFDIDLTRRHLAAHAPHLRLEVVDDAAGALELLPRGPGEPSSIDILLLDYRLSGLDALELTKTLRQERGLDLPIVMVTGQGSEEVAVRALQLGANEYLAKHDMYLYELSAVLEKAYRQVELLREQAALRESEERFSSIFENASDGILLADVETRKFIAANPAMLRMLGYSADEITALGVDDIHPRESLQQALEYFERQARGETALAPDIPVQRKDGSVFYADIRASLLSLGGKTCLIDVFHDITERKKAEARLRQTAAVFDNTQDGIVVTDLDANIVAVNRAFCEITGYAEEELIGMNPRILQSGRQGRDFYQALWANLLETGLWRGEIWNRRKNGEVYPEWKTINVVRDAQGRPVQYIAVTTDLSRIKASEERIEHLAHYDPLTGLPNRLQVLSLLQHAVEHARRLGHRVGALYLDLDRFKTVNDSLGHPAGDELLVAVTQAMVGRLRKEDTLARLGGDEFLAVLDYLQRPEGAAGVAQSLIDRLERPFRLAGGREVYTGASVGISLYPDDAATVTELIQHADAAMFQAKQAGRKTYRFYTEVLTAAARERLEIETGLRHALERGEFLLHYQPLVEGRDGASVVGVEALLRWQPPGGELVPPDRFISIAEETGLIVPIGEWVLRTACMQARRWMDAGLPPFVVAVNLSVRQFQSNDVADLVRRVLAETGLPSERLELELTESILMEQGEQALATLDALKSLGVRLAIDDFGTGYSSLAYLKRMPIDKLKIDRSFVQDIVDDEGDREIAATIISMSKTFKMQVLAEGVETLEQIDILAGLGCKIFQGFYFSKPLPVQEVEAFLRSHTG